MILLILAIIFFGTLTVEMDEEFVRLRFDIGWIEKKINLADVNGQRIIRNKWYYGWGIRYTPHGVLYNVSGLETVEVQLKIVKRFESAPMIRRDCIQLYQIAVLQISPQIPQISTDGKLVSNFQYARPNSSLNLEVE